MLVVHCECMIWIYMWLICLLTPRLFTNHWAYYLISAKIAKQFNFFIGHCFVKSAFSFVFHDILTNIEDIWNVMRLFHNITWYEHQTLIYAPGNKWPTLATFFPIFLNIDFSFSCVNAGDGSSQSKENGASFVKNRFNFDEMVTVLLFMYQ